VIQPPESKKYIATNYANYQALQRTRTPEKVSGKRIINGSWGPFIIWPAEAEEEQLCKRLNFFMPTLPEQRSTYLVSEKISTSHFQEFQSKINSQKAIPFLCLRLLSFCSFSCFLAICWTTTPSQNIKATNIHVKERFFPENLLSFFRSPTKRNHINHVLQSQLSSNTNRLLRTFVLDSFRKF